MSTSSHIAIENSDGSLFGIYCHFDGYPMGVGRTLIDHYKTDSRARALVAGGDLSSVPEPPEQPVDGPKLADHAPVPFSGLASMAEWLRETDREWCYVWRSAESRWYVAPIPWASENYQDGRALGGLVPLADHPETFLELFHVRTYGDGRAHGVTLPGFYWRRAAHGEQPAAGPFGPFESWKEVHTNREAMDALPIVAHVH